MHPIHLVFKKSFNERLVLIICRTTFDNLSAPDVIIKILMREHLRIGRINYANLFPIFYMLEHRCDCSAYSFIEGVPSELNRLLRDGEIDISPSSSIEYLRHKDMYTILDGHSISSFGPIGSILLFSTRPIETLRGSTILTSSQSETSVVLLDIILKKFYSIDCILKPSNNSFSKAFEYYPAYLLIGDDAMKAEKKVRSSESRVRGKTLNSKLNTQNSELFVYDLGDLWHKNTGLPFVFALWIARKDSETKMLLAKFRSDLSKAKDAALKNLKVMAGESDLITTMSEDEIVSYWAGISYDLDNEHKKGLELFSKYAEELKLF